jgi:mono/diheme cytochrome c family protein
MGGFFSKIRGRATVLGACGLLLGGPWSSASAEDGKQAYEANCVSCHGAAGKGDGPAGQFMNPKPKEFAAVLKDASDADLAKIVREGGQATGKSALMPAYKGKLSDEQVEAVVKYVRSLAPK